MKLIIAGGRGYCIGEAGFAWLDKIPNVTEVVSGGAAGADSGGEEWARRNGIPIKRFLAEWKVHGRAAGPMRNREMAEYAHAVALFPGGKGTASMEREAERAGLEIFKWCEDKLPRLIEKYQLTSENLHEPNPSCKFCKGQGERPIKSRPGEMHFCVCLFVDHDMSDLAGEMLGEFAKKQLAKMKERK